MQWMGKGGSREDRDRGLRGLLSDPPLRDRITWREGIQPQTLISEDRGLMARTFGTLFVLGGLLGLFLLVIREDAEREVTSLALLSALTVLLGAVSFVGYRRLPVPFFHVLLVAGTAMITIQGAASSEGGEAAYAFYYVWIVLIASLFFSLRAAAVHATIAAVAFAAVLLAEDTPYRINLLVSMVATFGTTGAITAILRGRIEGVATELSAKAHTDTTTALTNRRGFDEAFKAEIERARRFARSLSLIICDLDRFKAVNDKLGHAEGDTALRRASAAIVEATRGSDLVARLGGEEFGILLPDTAGPAAFAVAERIRDTIGTEFDGYPVAVTVSCGVATLEVGAGRHELFHAADTALFAAKREGRNRSATGAG